MIYNIYSFYAYFLWNFLRKLRERENENNKLRHHEVISMVCYSVLSSAIALGQSVRDKSLSYRKTLNTIFCNKRRNSRVLIGREQQSVFTHVASIYGNLLEQKKVFTYEKSSTPTRLVWNVVWNTNMAAVALFWNTNMAAMTSWVNAQLSIKTKSNDKYHNNYNHTFYFL